MIMWPVFTDAFPIEMPTHPTIAWNHVEEKRIHASEELPF
jgi:hypothetical protein